MSNKEWNLDQDFRERLIEGLWLGFLTFVFVLSAVLLVVLRTRRFWFSRGLAGTAAVCGVCLVLALWAHMDPFVDGMALNPLCVVYDPDPVVLFKHIKVIMWFDGQMGGLITERHNRKYAKNAGNIAFERMTGCAPLNRALQWAKIALLRLEMDRVGAMTKWIVWIDSDAVFTNWRVSLSAALDEEDEKTLVIVGGDLEELGRPLNTGFIAVRVCKGSQHLLDKIWNLGAKLGRKWRFGHEQEALTVLMRKDPDVKSQVVIWKEKVRMFSEKDDSLKGDELVLHAAGWPGDAKLKAAHIMIARTLYE